MSGFAPTPSPKGMQGPLSVSAGAAWCFDTIYGVAVSTAALGNFPAQPLAGEPPSCPPSARGVLRGPALLCPPPSLPALLQEEIQQLKSKLEKVEKERNELRLNSDRLESRVGPAGTGRGCDAVPWPMDPFHPPVPRSQS